MSNRSSARLIAKSRLEAMNVQNVNKAFGLGLRNSENRKLQSTLVGRKILAKMHRNRVPVWRQVISGNLAKDGYCAQMGIGKKRSYKIAQ